MGQASAREVGDVSDRLAYVCSCALAAALQARGQREPAALTPVEAGRPSAAAPSLAAPFSLSAPRAGVQIVDELDPESSGASQAAGGTGEGLAEIEIRDQRVRPGPSAWIETIGHRLDAFGRDGRPFSVLLIEPVLPAKAGEHGDAAAIAAVAERIERALAAELNAQGSGQASEVLTREAPGRWWVLSGESERAGADALAARLARAAEAITDEHGEPVQLLVGTAVCPADGREPATLAAHADVGLFAARAASRVAGRRIATGADDLG